MRRAVSTGILLLAFGFDSPRGPPAAIAAIPDRVTSTVLTLPAALEANQSNFCTWGPCSLSPRLYHAPLADGRTLIGWTDASLNGHVSVADGATLTTTFNFPARPVRGLVGHDDGSFAVLLWDRGAAPPEDDIMWISRRNASGVEQWAARATSVSNIPSAAGAHVGDSRLAYGGGIYGAYLSVHGISGPFAGHEGDQYARVTDAGAPAAGGWSFGLSHSMAQLVAPHPDLSSLTTVACSDCFPAKGLYTGLSRQLLASDANCDGLIQVQLGQMAAAAGDRWLVAFNEVDRPGFPAQGIGLARFGATGSASVTWLTNTTGVEERDPVLARIGSSTGSNRYLVGWRLQTSGEFRLAIVDTLGAIIEGPALLGPTVKWGNRDDSFRARPDGSISWVQGDAGSATLRYSEFCDSPGTYFRDADIDGFGDPAVSLQTCAGQPAGYVADNTDCFDGNPTIHPGAAEVCDGLDNDCNGQVDEIAQAAGLVGWWPGNGDANDATGINDGSAGGTTTYVAGRVGQAFSFDGAGYVTDLGTTANFSFIENTAVFTIEAWIKLNDATALIQQAITANTSTSNEKGHFFLWENSAGEQRLRLALMKSTSGMPLIESTSPTHVIVTNDWHHVAAVGDGVNVTFYVDGAAYPGSGVMGAKPSGSSTRTLNFARCPAPSPECQFSGLIDEPAIYNRALSAAEIQAIYNAGSGGRCALTAVNDPSPATRRVEFAPPWPNPAERVMNFEFHLSASAVVRAQVVDVAGRRVSPLLADGVLAAGAYRLQWDCRDASGIRVGPGVYLIRISTGTASAVHRIVVIK